MFSTVGDILSTVADVQYRGGIHDKCGGYLEYRGDTQYRRGYMMHVGRYREYRGRIQSFVISVPPWY